MGKDCSQNDQWRRSCAFWWTALEPHDYMSWPILMLRELYKHSSAMQEQPSIRDLRPDAGAGTRWVDIINHDAHRLT